MFKEALQWLKDNAQPTVITVGDKQFSDGAFTIIEDKPDLASALEVATLSGLADLVKGGFEGITADQFLAHVVGPTQVDVISKNSDEHGRRKRFVTAKANPRT